MNSTMSSPGWLKWLLAAVILLLIGTARVDRFWVIDSGLTWWQIHYGDLLAVSSPDDPAFGELPWLQSQTPAADYFAVPPPFALRTERGPRIVFGSLYPALNRPFDFIAGKWGVRLLMLLWVGVLLWALRRLNATDPLTLLLLLATPLLFYALQVWSHFAAAAVVLLALSFLEAPLVAGSLLMLAALFRLEAGVIILALLLYWLWRRRWRSAGLLLLVLVVIGLCWAGWNHFTTGYWQPLQWVANRSNPEAAWSPLAVLERLEYLLVPLRSYPLVGVAVMGGLFGALTAGNRTGRLLLCLFGINGLWLVYLFYSDTGIQNHLGLYASLLASAPLLVMAFRPLRHRWLDQDELKPAVSEKLRELQWLFWLSLGLIILLLPLHTGFHWGPRWLLVLVPIAAVVAAPGWRKPGWRWLPALLLLVSLLLQTGSVMLLRERQALQQDYVSLIEQEDCRVIL
ncbi:MAG: hypothetical protein ISR91_06860, partial [Candidatus Delongbacteria bacterium]|nr:hypothetical protein [Candidatus Delongbacteria bacterium]